MKKRLLSAALALAMVLTMLPLTVFAVDTAPTVTYYTTALANTPGKTNGHGVGWFTSTTADGITTYEEKSTGVIIGTGTSGKWYGSVSEALRSSTSAPTSLKLIGPGSLDVTEANNSLTIDVNGQNLSISGRLTQAADAGTKTKLTSLTITNSAKTGGVQDTDAVLSGSIDVTDQPFTFKASYTANSDGPAITFANSTTSAKALSVDLTAATVGNVTTSGTGAATVTVKAVATTKNMSAKVGDVAVNNSAASTASVTVTQSSGATKAEVGDVSVAMGSATINATATTKDAAAVGDVTVNGTAPSNNTLNLSATNITVSGGVVGNIAINGKVGTSTGNGIVLKDMATAGTIAVNGGTNYDAGSGNMKLPTWGGASYISVGSQCKTGEISVNGSSTSAAINISITGGSGSTDGVASIDISGTTAVSKVTVSGGTVGKSAATAIKMKNGTLEISNGAQVGAVVLTGTITATVKDKNTKVASIDAHEATDATVNISGGSITANTNCVQLKTGYNKQTITGGTFGSSIKENSGWLKNVTYEIKDPNALGTGTAGYTYTSSFQDCVDAYKGNSGVEITIVGSTGAFEVSFFLNAPTSGAAQASEGDEENPGGGQGGQQASSTPVVVIKTDTSHGITLPATINSKPVDTWYYNDAPYKAGALMKFEGAALLYTTISSADNSEIVGVTVSKTAPADSSALSGADGLSAALTNNTIKVSGALPADSNGFVPIALDVKTALGNKYSIIVEYAVAEKKLVPGNLANSPLVAGIDNASLQVRGTTLVYPLDGSGLIVSIGGVSVSAQTNCKAEGTSNVSGVTGVTKAQLELALDGVTADFSASVAVQQAANKVKYDLTETQKNNFIRQGRIAAWKAVNPTLTRSPTEDEIAAQGSFDTLEVEVYLDIRATGYNQNANAQSITLNITPYYRLNVKEGPTGTTKHTVQTGRALTMTGLTGEYGDVVINVSSMGTLINGLTWAHHGDYVYGISGSSFTTKHGFSPFTLNMVDPVACVYAKGAAPNAGLTGAKAYYDNVQTAINEAEDGETVCLYPNYSKSTETYNFTGDPRTITFDPGTNGTFVPTFSSANVTADKTDGNVWTVQLNTATTTTPAATTATISTQNATNGTARANVSSAKAGDKVTITTTAYNGYQAQTPIVRTNTNATVPVTAAGSTNATTAQWTFTVPSGATSITITPSFTQSIIPFTDVRSDAWYYNGIAYCYNTTAPSGDKLMVGESSYIFSPERPVKRAEVAVLLYRLGSGSVETPKLNFTDVSAGYYAYNAIVWCANHGFVRGSGDATFRPEDYITRQELAQMLYNYAGAGTRVNYNLSTNYTDGDNVPGWAVDAVSWAAYYGILSGTNSVNMSGSLSSTSNALRGQVAVTIMKFHQRFVR